MIQAGVEVGCACFTFKVQSTLKKIILHVNIIPFTALMRLIIIVLLYDGKPH